MLIVSLLFGSTAFFGVFSVSAQTVSSVQKEEAELRERLKQLEIEIAKQQVLLENQRGESQSIQKEINKLKAEIDKTRLEIQKKETLIKQLSGQIVQKEQTITSLSTELEREKASLAQLIRKTREIDDQSLIEVLLSKQSVSHFYQDLDTFLTLQDALYDSSNVLKRVRVQTDVEKQDLEKKKAEQADIKYELEQARKQVESKESEQKNLLNISKSTEDTYEAVIRERQAQAASIRARLFELAGGVQGGGIAFGDALKYANEASAKTGVRPAIILAILQQESDMGKNVGTCNRPGDSRTWKDIMPGPTSGSWRDDQTAFLQIMNELGIPPEGQPLSCPLASGGWGGAMGPTQFIPTTWLSIRTRLASLLGVAATNPWNPRHAVHATALYMADLGASAGGYTAERNAACKYYSGRACGQSSVPNTFYGDQVMNKAAAIQVDIDFLTDQGND